MIELVSLIVPVYNAEEFIEKNIRRLLEQTYKNLEIIIIDDGSQDNTLSKCLSLSKTDNRIRVFSHSNHGVSYTRNMGMKYAKGSYCMFIDADDSIEANTVEDMHRFFQECDVDVVLCGYLSVSDCVRKEYLADIATGVYAKNVFFKNIEHFMEKHLIDNIGTKMYKSSVIKANGLLFNELMDLYEDVSFCINYLKKCDNIAYINKAYYVYNIGINTQSLSSGFNIKAAENSMQYISYLKEYFEYWGATGRKKLLVESTNRIVNVVYMAALVNVSMLNYIINFYNKQTYIKEILSSRGGIPLKQRIVLLLVDYKCSWVLYLIIRLKKFISNHK